jgi:hypothetical protein
VQREQEEPLSIAIRSELLMGLKGISSAPVAVNQVFEMTEDDR